MNKATFTFILLATGAVSSAATTASAQEVARVVSSTPVTQQVGVPRQVCTTAPAPSGATQCTTQTIYENRTTAYQVVYEYAGKQYSVQLPQDPGPTLTLRVSVEPVRGQPAPVALGEAVDASAVVLAPVASAAVPYPAYVYYNGYPGYVGYYGSPYYGYWGPTIALGFFGGYYGGRFGGHHGGHHGRR